MGQIFFFFLKSNSKWLTGETAARLQSSHVVSSGYKGRTWSRDGKAIGRAPDVRFRGEEEPQCSHMFYNPEAGRTLFSLDGQTEGRTDGWMFSLLNLQLQRRAEHQTINTPFRRLSHTWVCQSSARFDLTWSVGLFHDVTVTSEQSWKT